MGEGHSDYVSSICFSGDGTQIASGSGDKTVKVWNTRTGELERTLEGHSGGVFSVYFSGDGTQIASGSRDRTVKLWNTRTGELERTLEGHGNIVTPYASVETGLRLRRGLGIRL